MAMIKETVKTTSDELQVTLKELKILNKENRELVERIQQRLNGAPVAESVESNPSCNCQQCVFLEEADRTAEVDLGWCWKQETAVLTNDTCEHFKR